MQAVSRVGATALFTFIAWFCATTAAFAAERHIGYYYPDPGTPETYNARALVMPNVTRNTRLAFITGIANEGRKRPYPPVLSMFAKGNEAQKLIIVALQDGHIDTVYRARAVYADMTSIARLLPIFQELGVQDSFTFFDLLKMMGFIQVTITNGHDFAHQVLIH